MRLNKKIIVSVVILLVVLTCGYIFFEKGIEKKSERNTLKVENAEINDDIQMGEMEIVYCDNDKLIFKDYYGLFIYSLETNQIINSLDVKYINCHLSQGDNVCQFKTYDNGSIIELYTENEDYYFDWDKNKLYTDYDTSKQEEDKNDNLKVIEPRKDLENINSYAFNYVDYNGSKLYLTCSGKEEILNNLSYVIEDESGEIIRNNYIFRKS